MTNIDIVKSAKKVKKVVKKQVIKGRDLISKQLELIFEDLKTLHNKMKSGKR